MVDLKLHQFLIKRHTTKTLEGETQNNKSTLQFIHACNNENFTITRLQNWHAVRYRVRNAEQHE
jgi:hypothetical protein